MRARRCYRMSRNHITGCRFGAALRTHMNSAPHSHGGDRRFETPTKSFSMRKCRHLGKRRSRKRIRIADEVDPFDMNIVYEHSRQISDKEFIDVLQRSTLAERRPVDDPA